LRNESTQKKAISATSAMTPSTIKKSNKPDGIWLVVAGMSRSIG
jgi:hypothetical protein